MVLQADEALAESLIQYIESQSSFAIAVANRDLVVNGEVVTGNLGAARELATRLHLLGIGAVRFQRGLTLASLSQLVALLARRPADVPDGAAFPDLQGIVVGRVDYEQLGLADEATLRAEGQQLWQMLATRLLDRLLTGAGGAVAAEGVGSGQPGTTAPTLGTLLQRAAVDVHAAEEAFAALNDIAERVSMAPRTVRDTVGAQMDELFAAVDDAALVATLRSAPMAARTRFTSALVELLPSASMIRWLTIAADANGRELSPHLVRLVTKMSAHQIGRSPEAADQSLRETMLALVQGWDTSGPDPAEHHLLLDTLAEWSALERSKLQEGDTVHLDPMSHEAIRLVQMACELDYVSDDAVQAVRHLADHGFTTQLLDWSEQATSDGTRIRLRELSVTAQSAADTLLATPFDAAAAKQLLDAMPDSAAQLLIDPLEVCESRAGRRLIYDRLHRVGPALEPALRERLLHPMPWYLARNLLGLLRDIAVGHPESVGVASAPAGPLLLFQSHEHPLVRREAMRVLAHHGSTRSAALRRALDDPSDDVRQAAVETILALRNVELPREVITRLLAIADSETVEMDRREKALRAAVAVCGPVGSTHAGQAEVRAWLVAHCTRRGLLKGIKLAPATPLVRAGVQLLAARFGAHEDVAPIVALARSEGLLK